MALPVNAYLIGRTHVIALPNIRLYDEEEHLITRSVTRYPIEDGSNLIDHAIREPAEVTLRGFVAASMIEPEIADGFDPLDEAELRRLAAQFDTGVAG